MCTIAFSIHIESPIFLECNSIRFFFTMLIPTFIASILISKSLNHTIPFDAFQRIKYFECNFLLRMT